jgi:hypothetical protein
MDVLGDEGNFNWLVVLGIKSEDSLNFDYFGCVFSLFEVHFSHSESVESLVDEFLMVCLILLIVFERLCDFLYLYPFIKRVYHLELLFGNAFEDLFLDNELIVKLFHF